MFAVCPLVAQNHYSGSYSLRGKNPRHLQSQPTCCHFCLFSSHVNQTWVDRKSLLPSSPYKPFLKWLQLDHCLLMDEKCDRVTSPKFLNEPAKQLAIWVGGWECLLLSADSTLQTYQNEPASLGFLYQLLKPLAKNHKGLF